MLPQPYFPLRFRFYHQRIARKLSPLSLMACLLLTLLLAACQPVAPVAPEVDRIGFPENYQTDYSIFYEFDRPDNKSARVIYANPAAAQVQEGEPFPYGSELVMAVYRTERDDADNVVLDANGRYTRGELFGLFVMRKSQGFGAKYGVLRNGEWEYVAYRPDETVLTPPERTTACAACHVEAGQGRDWVFGTDRHFQADHAAMADLPENTVNVVDYTLTPAVITTTVGSEVTWNNNDVLIHTVTANELTFNSGALRPQASFTRLFEEAGEFEYFCAIHASMKGKVVVVE